MESTQYLRVEIQNHICRIALNRDEARNALNLQMLRELTDVISWVEQSEDIRVLVLTGEGKAFCAGADLQEVLGYKFEQNDTSQPDFGGMLATLLCNIRHCSKPVVAAVNGAVMGGGLGLMCAADIVVVAEHVKFAFPEVKLGLIPAVISSFVVERMGISPARKLMLTGEVFSSLEAKQLGLVHQVVEISELESSVAKIAEQLCSAAPEALNQCKQLLEYIQEHSLEQNLEYAALAFNKLTQHPETKRRVSRFLNKEDS